jgi:hypothetical protein
MSAATHLASYELIYQTNISEIARSSKAADTKMADSLSTARNTVLGLITGGSPNTVLTNYERVFAAHWLGLIPSYHSGDLTGYNAWQTSRNALLAIMT